MQEFATTEQVVGQFVRKLHDMDPSAIRLRTGFKNRLDDLSAALADRLKSLDKKVSLKLRQFRDLLDLRNMLCHGEAIVLQQKDGAWVAHYRMSLGGKQARHLEELIYQADANARFRHVHATGQSVRAKLKAIEAKLDAKARKSESSESSTDPVK